MQFNDAIPGDKKKKSNQKKITVDQLAFCPSGK